MQTGMDWLRILAGVITILMGVLVDIQGVSAQTATKSDPSGDTDFNAPGFQDIIRSEVSKEGDEFVLRMEVAAPIPLNPPLPHPAEHEMWWFWVFGLDPRAPAGFPISPGNTLPSEVHARIVWDGTSFQGTVIDRRPLLDGGQAVILTVPFNIKGASLELHVPSAMLGNPSTFNWGSLTSDWSGPEGTAGFHFVDSIRATTDPPIYWP